MGAQENKQSAMDAYAAFSSGDAEGVVLSTVSLGGETTEVADVFTYNDAGKVVAFESVSDPSVANRVFAR